MKTDSNGVRVEFMALSEVLPAELNSKDHNLGELILSMDRFGFCAPALLDETSGRLIAGHGRREALIMMERDGYGLPEGVRLTESGEWAMPVLRGMFFDDETEAASYRVADNRLTELGGWIEPELLFTLQEIVKADGVNGLEGIGFDEEDIADLILKLEGSDDDHLGGGDEKGDELPVCEMCGQTLKGGNR